MPAVENFEMHAGDTKTLVVTVRDDANAVVDLTGASIRWQMGRSVRAAPLIAKELGAGITTPDPTSGRFDVLLDSVDTEFMRSGDYIHEAEIIEASGAVATVIVGMMTLNPSLVKAV